jgi:predicted  nucleic acid-binding Zn-ribbon protein
MTQMRTRIRSLDFEVARLKPFEAEVGKLKDLLSAKVAEYDKLASQLTEKTGECSRLIVQQGETDAQLAKKLAQLDQVETRLADAEIRCTDLRGKLTALEVQKEEAEAKLVSTEAKLVSTEAEFSKLEVQLKAVETQLAVEKKEAEEDFLEMLHKMEEYEGKCYKLRKRYHHYKAKAARFLKQLSFTPWYRDQSWVKGFRWGFESFRTIVLNPSIFKVDLKTVLAGYLPPPERATDELLDLGKDLFPDVPRWTDEQADYPEDPSLPTVPSDISDSDSDDYGPDV